VGCGGFDGVYGLCEWDGEGSSFSWLCVCVCVYVCMCVCVCVVPKSAVSVDG
jgi:predicted histidine transporter YuiF (NhaC family)